MTLAELAAAIATGAILCCAAVTRPQRARCPDGTDLRTGVRRDGRYDCWPLPSGPMHVDQRTNAWVDDSVQPGWRLGGRVYCTGGAVPHQDGFSVWCQR